MHDRPEGGAHDHGRSRRLAIPALDANGLALLIILSVLWGGSFYFAKVALSEVDPLTLVLARVAIAAATLHAVMAFLGRRPLWRVPRAWRVLAFGITNNVIPFSLIFWAQQFLDIGIAAILNGLTPIFTMLFAAVATADERITALKAAGMVIAFAGVGAIVGIKQMSGAGDHLWPALALIGASVAYAGSAIWARSLRDVAPIEIAAGQLTGSTIVLAVAVPFLAPPLLTVPALETVAAILVLAIASTAFAYLIFFRLIRTAGATSASLVTFLVPVTAALLGAIFLGERLSVSALAGMAMVLLGVALAQAHAFVRTG